MPALNRETGVDKAISALSVTSPRRTLAAVERLGAFIRDASATQQERTLAVTALAAFIREHAPLGSRPGAAAPVEEVQAALNILAALRPANACSGAVPGLDLRHTDLRGAWLASGNFRSARFDGSCLHQVDLSYACLEQASFRGADLAEATFAHSMLAGADFSGARFDDTDVTGTGVSSLSLAEAPDAPRWADRAA